MINKLNTVYDFLFEKKRIIIPGLFFATLFVLSLMFLSEKKPTPPILALPTPTPITNGVFNQSSASISLLLEQDVKDIHWLNNQEIAYTYFDSTIKQRILAKTNGQQATILLVNPELKFSEVYWSTNNDLLVFNYGIPYQTYLYTKGGVLKNLNINGYGFSWSPDGKSFFYLELGQDGKTTPKVYSLETNLSSSLETPPLSHQLSFWSPDEKTILLYDFNIETGSGTVRFLDIANRIVQSHIENVLYPTWSPLGDKIVYVSDNGIHLYANGTDRLVYQASGNPTHLSYAWSDNNNVYIIDTQKAFTTSSLISLQNEGEKRIAKELPFENNQRISIAVSLDKKNVAAASEKNGLWLIPTALYGE